MDIAHLSHRSDPETSVLASAKLDPHQMTTLKDALIDLLAERPRTADEITFAYFHRAETEQWPLFEDRHNVKRRLSELVHKHGVARDSGERRLSARGRKSVVWKLTVPADYAKIAVRVEA